MFSKGGLSVHKLINLVISLLNFLPSFHTLVEYLFRKYFQVPPSISIFLELLHLKDPLLTSFAEHYRLAFFCMCSKVVLTLCSYQRGIQRGAWGGGGAPFFCNHLFFCNHFEELQTVLIAVKLIINNALLAYVYPNTIKTYLTLNHLLFGRQLLCYSHTTSTVVRNLTALSSTTDKINSINNHF